jgi:hypothetical protein
MNMQVALEIIRLQQAGQAVPQGRLHFSPVFPEFGRNPG